MANCNRATLYRQHLTAIVASQNICWLDCSLDFNPILLKINKNERAFTFTCLCAVFTVAIAAAAASSASIFIGWWSLPFHYLAKMATIEGEKCPTFPHFLTIMSTPSGYAIIVSVNAHTQNSKCKHTRYEP